jgi:hypothetical protein
VTVSKEDQRTKDNLSVGAMRDFSNLKSILANIDISQSNNYRKEGVIYD